MNSLCFVGKTTWFFLSTVLSLAEKAAPAAARCSARQTLLSHTDSMGDKQACAQDVAYLKQSVTALHTYTYTYIHTPLSPPKVTCDDSALSSTNLRHSLNSFNLPQLQQDTL